MLGVWEDESDGSSLGTIHIFFPGLGSNSPRPALLSEDEVRTLYERGLRPCIARILPEAALDWPQSYELSCPYEIHDTAGAVGENSYAGTGALRSVTFPPSSMNDFAPTLRRLLQLNEVEWAKGLFFLHRVCGMKSATQHQKTLNSARSACFKAFERAHIPFESTSQGDWWIDVGLEFHGDKGEIFQWNTDAHHRVVENVLEIPKDTAMFITTPGLRAYRRNIACHIPQASGCRIEYEMEYKGRWCTSYLELTTTEMSGQQYSTSNISGTARTLSIRQAMDSCRPVQKALDMMDALSKQAETSSQSLANARIGLRVPVDYVNDFLVDDLDEATVRESLLSFSERDWL